MATAAELRELAGLLEQRAALEAHIASAQAQHDRLNNENAAILASLRVQAMVEAKEEVARQTASERAEIAGKHLALDELMEEVRKVKADVANALAKINNEAESRINAKIAAAHAAARSALADA